MAIAFMNNDLQSDDVAAFCESIPYRAAIRIGNPFHPSSYVTFAQEGAPPSLDPAHPGSLNFLVTFLSLFKLENAIGSFWIKFSG